jgi:hypothetical protein
MEQNNLPKFLQSSIDPTKVSLTVESIGKALIGVVAMFAVAKGLNPDTATNQYQLLVDTVASGTAAVVTVYHSIGVVYGIVRKIVMKLSNRAN